MEQLQMKMKASTVPMMLPTIMFQRIMFMRKVYTQAKYTARVKINPNWE